MLAQSTEVRITAENIMSRLHTEAHDQAHQRIDEATRPRPSRRVRPALNGVEVKHYEFTATGCLLTLMDGTTAYVSREAGVTR